MARIPEEEIRRLKDETDLVALIGASGVELKPVGTDLRGRCPFHEDDGPSLIVTPAKNLWHCLGACGVGGSAIDWVMKTQKVSFRHAVEILRHRSVTDPLPAVRAKHVSKIRHLPEAVELSADDQRLLNQVVDFYHENLKRAPEGLKYLEGRGLRHGEAVNRFKLGFANRTLSYRLPSPNSNAGAEVRERLQRLGILRSTGHEHFVGSIVIPIFDEAKNVVGLYGRKITPNLHADIPRHLYLPGAHKGVWNLEALQGSREIILCEALIDALTFWCAGYRNVTTSYGVHGFTDDHAAAFAKYGVRKVLVAYDRDDAGEKAAAELAPRLAERGLEVARIQFPRGMDANEYAKAVANPSEAFGVLIKSAIFVAKGKAIAAAAPEPPPSPEVREESPPPLAASDSSPLCAAGDQAQLVVGDRTYRVRGLAKNTTPEQLRVNVRVSRGDDYHVDTFDLFSARQRVLFIKQAADELSVNVEVLKRDVGKLLFELEALQEKRLADATQPKDKAVQISEPEKAEALALLQDPKLLDRIVADFEKVGVIGESTNALVGYLAAVSRKMEDPLALLIQSNSAAGKSTLMDAVLALMPEEDLERFTAMTGQSLYYMAGSSFKHKILAIAEVAGAEKAGYAIKMLQSEGRISIATTIKDPETGELRTKKHEVEGPVAIMLTTTEASVDEELQNRAVVLTVNEDRSQTRAIHEAQRRRETLEGMLARQDRTAVMKLHQNAQRLLKPLLVVNPFARSLTFLDTKLRARRDHVKYLTLIRAIALLHQYQRPLRHLQHNGRTIPYLEVELSDVQTANRLAGEVLGRSLDELAPQTRRLLTLLDQMVREKTKALEIDREDFRFSRRDAREATNWGHSQLAVHLERLVELEYLAVHRGGRGQSFVYELVYDGSGSDGRRFVVGLIDPGKLYDANLPASEAHLPAPFRPASGGVPAPSGPADSSFKSVPEASRPSFPPLAARQAQIPETDETVVVVGQPSASRADATSAASAQLSDRG